MFFSIFFGLYETVNIRYLEVFQDFCNFLKFPFVISIFIIKKYLIIIFF